MVHLGLPHLDLPKAFLKHGPDMLWSWHKAVIPDGLLRIISKAGMDNKEGEEALTQVGDLSRAWLVGFEKARPTMNASLLELSAPIVHVLRALVAVVVPIPGLHEACLCDVDYACPGNGTDAPIMKDIPRIGRILANKFREKDGLLLHRVEEYKTYHGAEVSHSAKFLELFCESQRLRATDAPDTCEAWESCVDDLVAFAQEYLPVFKSDLRPKGDIGAVRELGRHHDHAFRSDARRHFAGRCFERGSWAGEAYRDLGHPSRGGPLAISHGADRGVAGKGDRGPCSSGSECLHGFRQVDFL